MTWPKLLMISLKLQYDDEHVPVLRFVSKRGWLAAERCRTRPGERLTDCRYASSGAAVRRQTDLGEQKEWLVMSEKEESGGRMEIDALPDAVFGGITEY
jgi:hypothetical protein